MIQKIYNLEFRNKVRKINVNNVGWILTEYEQKISILRDKKLAVMIRWIDKHTVSIHCQNCDDDEYEFCEHSISAFAVWNFYTENGYTKSKVQ